MKEIERLKILIEDDEKITCKRKTERIKYRNRKNRKSRKARNRKKRYGKRKTRIKDNNRSKNRRAREIKITKTKKTKTLERQEVKRIAKEFHELANNSNVNLRIESKRTIFSIAQHINNA